METNEDGFTRSNIVAICRTGKSSKRSPLDNNTIGEKGFGFKSVFVVANRVEIQSGFWSFAFEHEKGEDGLGMVTPIDAEPVRLDSNIRTRITLSFNHHYRSEAAHNRLLDDLESLPSTIILFLQQLRKLTIQVRCPGRAHKTITLEKKEVSSDASDMVRLKRTIAVDDEQVNDGVFEEELYIIKSEIVKNMPADDMRENVRPPEVILGFPVDSSARRPEISSSGREIFAFLPLRSFSSLKVRSFFPRWSAFMLILARSFLFSPILLLLRAAKTSLTAPGMKRCATALRTCSFLRWWNSVKLVTR